MNVCLQSAMKLPVSTRVSSDHQEGIFPDNLDEDSEIIELIITHARICPKDTY